MGMPEQSHSAWDVETHVATLAADDAAVSPAEANCALLPA
jgi:hypothetical protein